MTAPRPRSGPRDVSNTLNLMLEQTAHGQPVQPAVRTLFALNQRAGFRGIVTLSWTTVCLLRKAGVGVEVDDDSPPHHRMVRDVLEEEDLRDVNQFAWALRAQCDANPGGEFVTGFVLTLMLSLWKGAPQVARRLIDAHHMNYLGDIRYRRRTAS